ncbi:hypothetical protein D3C78_1822020 [compost metagenome]
MHRVAVAGNLREQLDVAFLHGALVGGLLADLQFIVGGVFYQTHGFSWLIKWLSFACPGATRPVRGDLVAG